MDAFFKFSRGGLDERRETKNLRGVYPRQIYYPDDPIYNDAQQDSRLTPTLFHRQRQKRTAVIFLFEKRVHPHRNWKVLRHIVDSRGGHMFSLRRVSSYLLVLFRGFHPIVIPKIPSQNILSISDREGKTYYRVSKGDKEKKKKTSKIYNENKSNKLLYIAFVQCIIIIFLNQALIFLDFRTDRLWNIYICNFHWNNVRGKIFFHKANHTLGGSRFFPARSAFKRCRVKWCCFS